MVRQRRYTRRRSFKDRTDRRGFSSMLTGYSTAFLLHVVQHAGTADIETLGKRRRSASARRHLVYRDENDWGGR